MDLIKTFHETITLTGTVRLCWIVIDFHIIFDVDNSAS